MVVHLICNEKVVRSSRTGGSIFNFHRILVQPGRALRLGRRSRKFESYISDQFRGYGATVAQMLCKHKVRSSNLLNSTNLMGRSWNGSLKTERYLLGSIPKCSTNLISRSSNGKTIDSKPINVGSIPTRDASFQ